MSWVIRVKHRGGTATAHAATEQEANAAAAEVRSARGEWFEFVGSRGSVSMRPADIISVEVYRR